MSTSILKSGHHVSVEEGVHFSVLFLLIPLYWFRNYSGTTYRLFSQCNHYISCLTLTKNGFFMAILGVV